MSWEPWHARFSEYIGFNFGLFLTLIYHVDSENDYSTRQMDYDFFVHIIVGKEWLDIFQNVLFCAPLKKIFHTVVDQLEGELFVSSIIMSYINAQ